MVTFTFFTGHTCWFVVTEMTVFDSFVRVHEMLHGLEGMTVNIRSLICLADDVKQHGLLNMFIAFSFESHSFKVQDTKKQAHCFRTI